jgi:hypothetical protein
MAENLSYVDFMHICHSSLTSCKSDIEFDLQVVVSFIYLSVFCALL